MKLLVEIELTQDEEEEFPPFPTVESVKVNGKEVENFMSTDKDKCWHLLEEDIEGYSLFIEERIY